MHKTGTRLAKSDSLELSKAYLNHIGMFPAVLNSDMTHDRFDNLGLQLV